jgi:hypothetical protein
MRQLPADEIFKSLWDHAPDKAQRMPRNLELWNLEPRYTSFPVSRTYVRVVLLEALIIVALVIFGRLFS